MSESETPRPRYIRYENARKQRWKVVPTSYTVLIANIASKGADWRGSNKGDIIVQFESNRHDRGYTVDRERFGELMDAAAVAFKKIRKFEADTMAEVLKPKPTT